MNDKIVQCMVCDERFATLVESMQHPHMAAPDAVLHWGSGQGNQVTGHPAVPEAAPDETLYAEWIMHGGWDW